MASKPPMGWNSWDCFGTTVKESEVKANADYMASRLRRYGWQYIVVDIQWSDPKAKAHGYRPNADLAMDGYGRLIPAANRFPSAAGDRGFKPLADYVHSQGLKFGIHIMRGIPRQAVRTNSPIQGSSLRAADVANRASVCSWNTDMYGVDMTKPGGQAYYDSIAELYASWGVDFIKADNMLDPLHADEIEALSRAIDKTKRPIVLSLSPGPTYIRDASFLGRNGEMWRISNDFWDRWQDLKHQFQLLETWEPYTTPGSWPDADMLPLGRIAMRGERGDDRMTRFTHDEQHTLMSLWAIARSPLMYGGDLPSNDAFSLSLLTNEEVLEVNQNGANSHQLRRVGDQIAWASDVPQSNSKYLAVFNIGDNSPQDIRVDFARLRLPSTYEIRDLWQKTTLGKASRGHTFHLSPHASGLYKLTPSQ
ncbi:MAG: glycoside hydrolase family 27 protein [Bryobacteraceae bacterium]